MIATVFAALMMQIAIPEQAQPAPPADYAMEENWLCLPEREDACAIDLTATVVDEDGSTRVRKAAFMEEPDVDCFYIYPTISSDATANSDLEPGDGETRVVAAQFARFSTVCRPFAPMYRQVTLTALRAMMVGEDMGADYALAYGDVRAAFRHYLTHENEGRPFVLIGHSQGTAMLTQLVKDEIDEKEIASQLLSAMLIGLNVSEPKGGDVGGDFAGLPLCRAPSDTRCVISYVSFREASPPPENSRFGKVEAEGMQAACTNPANLDGAGGSVSLDAYFNNSGSILSEEEVSEWTAGTRIETPFVQVPGLVKGRCVSDENGSYLAISINAGAGPRTDEIIGDVKVGEQVLADWGLHLIDINLAQGNLMWLVRTQAEAWHAAN